MSFQDDPVYKNGVMVLTDEVKDTNDFIDAKGCRLYTFPLKASPDSRVTLYSLKMGKFHKLIEYKG